MCSPRIYLAARFARQHELRKIADELQVAGARVTSRWLDERPLEDCELETGKRAAALAQMDFNDLRDAEICIAFTEEGRGPNGRGGRHTEVGIALALNLRVILVGPREHVFHCLPEVEQYPDWRRARQALLEREAGEASGPKPLAARAPDELAALP